MFNYRNQKLVNGHTLRIEYCSLITHIFDIYVVHFKMCNHFSSFEEITESKNRGGFRGLLENSIATSHLPVLPYYVLIVCDPLFIPAPTPSSHHLFLYSTVPHPIKLKSVLSCFPFFSFLLLCLVRTHI